MKGGGKKIKEITTQKMFMRDEYTRSREYMVRRSWKSTTSTRSTPLLIFLR